MKIVKNPRVILLMLTFNHQDCILDAIKSIQNQSYRDFQLIVVDDDSTDSTYKILERIAESDPRILLKRNCHNLGMFQNLEKSLQEISKRDDWEFFAWIGPDDSWSIEWLEFLLENLSSSSQFGICQSYVTYKKIRTQDLRKFVTMSKQSLTFRRAKHLREGYGELMHGLWRKEVLVNLLGVVKRIPLEHLLKMENLLVAILINFSGFVVVKANLHTKNKYLSSRYRYSNDSFFGSPHKIFTSIISTIIPFLRIVLNAKETRGFLFGAWLIDCRIALLNRVNID